jgi:outer membrane protein TolC
MRFWTPGRRAAPTLLALAPALSCALALAPGTAVAQGTPVAGATKAASARPEYAAPERELSFAEFLAAVLRSNPDYLAEQPAVGIAAAERRAAGRLPDPELAAGHARDPEGGPASYSVGVNQTILLGGKRRARLAVAEHHLAAARAQVEDFARSLAAHAAEAYIDAAIAGRIYERQQRSVATLERLVAVNRERVRTGDLGELDLLQSQIELRQQQNELLTAGASRHEALLALAQLMGRHASDTLYTPAELPSPALEELTLDALVAEALQRRPDVIAARRGVSGAQAGVRLARADLVGDLGVGVSMQRSAAVAGLPAPRWGGAEFSVSLPFPLLGLLNRGELHVAQRSAEQAELAARAVEARAEGEVRRAHSRYRLAAARAAQYSEELLADAEKVLAGRLYSYQRGNEPLIEVLLAQRAADEIYLAAYEATGEALKALVALREAAGLGQQLGGGE